MYKYLIYFLFFTVSISASEPSKIAYVDSLSYDYYMRGEWKQLIELGKKATKEGLNFKYLQQRMGYAYYAMGDYYNSIRYYKNSLNFDENDQISHYYLYYSALNTANLPMARYHLSKLDNESRKNIDSKEYKILDCVDLEYNYKINNYILRANPHYKRIGFSTQLGYRLNLYQSISAYDQMTDLTNETVQNEYFASLSYSIFSGTNFNIAYHYVGTKISSETDTLKIPGNLLFGKLSQNWRRFDFSLSQSLFTNEFSKSFQTGFHVGYMLPSKFKIYLKSSLYTMTESDTTRLVFNQTIGTMIGRKLWLQGALTLGNLNNFVDNDGLYLYNSIDYTTFRTGASAYLYLNNHLTFFTNYTYDKKQTTETQYLYNQHSISGGLIWKI